MAIMTPFQGEDVVSITTTRSGELQIPFGKLTTWCKGSTPLKRGGKVRVLSVLRLRSLLFSICPRSLKDKILGYEPRDVTGSNPSEGT
jgi:hypothetical protein